MLNSHFSKTQSNEIGPDDLVGATLDWVNADPQGRSEDMEDPLKSIPIKKCSVQCMREEEEKQEALLEKNVSVHINPHADGKHRTCEKKKIKEHQASICWRKS